MPHHSPALASCSKFKLPSKDKHFGVHAVNFPAVSEFFQFFNEHAYLK